MRHIPVTQAFNRQAVVVLTVPEYQALREAYDKAIAEDPEAVTITKKQFIRLNAAYKTLARLEANGVDNWSGYSEGIKYDEETGEEI